MTKPKVLLAFSGGLDTSYCVKYLSDERGYEVHSALVDTGGFSPDELKDGTEFLTIYRTELTAIGQDNIAHRALAAFLRTLIGSNEFLHVD